MKSGVNLAIALVVVMALTFGQNAPVFSCKNDYSSVAATDPEQFALLTALKQEAR